MFPYCPIHYENMPIQIYWKVNHRKIENFLTKNSNIFHISAQNIDCVYSLEPPRRGGSNEYPQSTVLSRNKNNNVYPYKPQFYYIKVGFKGVKIIQACFRDVCIYVAMYVCIYLSVYNTDSIILGSLYDEWMIFNINDDMKT